MAARRVDFIERIQSFCRAAIQMSSGQVSIIARLIKSLTDDALRRTASRSMA
jgi:hypothetical protein